MKRSLSLVAGACALCFGTAAPAQDSQCYGYTSTTSQFPCGTDGNCTWWAAYKRPDLAAAGISGNANNWYTNASNLGFQRGSAPKIGSVVVFSNAPNGHVAYVESLGDNGSFSVSEMDWYGSFGSGVQSGTYTRNSNGTYSRNGGAQPWTLAGFIYRRLSSTNLYCDNLNSTWGICWTPTSTDVSCRGGKDWTLYDFQQGSVIRVSTNDYCLPAGGVGGGVPSASPDAQSSTTEPVNLTLDFDVLKPNTLSELLAGQVRLQPDQVVRLNAQLKAVHGNARDWMSPNKNTIETDFYVRIDNGAWTKIARTYTQASNLDQGETHTEHVLYTIPRNAKTISFYVKTDAEKELTETNESDNVSRIETFRVFNPAVFQTILNLLLND